jgi:hypothetical protein
VNLHRCSLLVFCLFVAGFHSLARGGALGDLAKQPDLTPEKLIRYCAGFAFELNAEPQDPDLFLQRKRGDCDDFATLVSQVLSGRGYKTKLVVVMMQQQTHVVCYVSEVHGFLDFNHRRDPHPIVASDGSLEDIAEKVAADFHGRWHMASEFKYQNKSPVYLNVAFPPATPLTKALAVDSPTSDPKSAGTRDAAPAASLPARPDAPEKMVPAEAPGR